MVKRDDDSTTIEQPGPEFAAQRLTFRRVVVSLCAVVIGLACLDLLGWIAHVSILTSFVPHYATMKPNTAICLGLLAAACCIDPVPGSTPDRMRGLAAACVAGLSLILSAGALLEYLVKAGIGLDTLILSVPADRLGEPIGRMSLGTAICLTVTGVAILLFSRLPRFSIGCLLTVCVIAFTALVGFLFNAGPLYGVPWLSSMAVHTSLCVLAVAMVVLISHPEREPVASLLRQTFSGGAPQWLLIGVTVLPVAVALPAVVAMRRGAVDVGFTMAVVVVALIGLQTWVLWRDSRVLYQAQLRRRKIESDLARSEKFAVVGRLSATISHELTNSLDIARNLAFLIEGAESLSEAQMFASLAGSQLAAINQITSQTSRFYEHRPELMNLKRGEDHPDTE